MKRVILGIIGWTLSWAGAAYGQAEGEATGIESFYPLLILLVVFGAIFYFMLIRPQRRRQQQMNQLIGSLKRGDKVITAGGIHGEIESVGDTSMVLVLEEGAKLRVAKTSVVRKVER